MNVEIGDVFWLSVTYPDTGETETRPVVIYAFVEGNPVFCSFATITRSEIKDFEAKYDKWKVPLFKWNDIPLRDLSYVKANCIATVDESAFLRENFIGKMSKIDLKNVTSKIEEFINSDEESW